MGKYQVHDWWQNKRSDSTQHKAELDAVKRFEEEVFEVAYLPPQGLLSEGRFLEARLS